MWQTNLYFSAFTSFRIGQGGAGLGGVGRKVEVPSYQVGLSLSCGRNKSDIG